jgi:hypothetical protein
LAYFYDSSVFAKLFVAETGAVEMTELYGRPADTHLISVLAPIEVRSAIRRREQMGDLSGQDASTALDDLMREAALIETIEVGPEVLLLASSLVDRHRLRALDSLQLASALISNSIRPPTTFVSADERLLRAAKEEGLTTCNPSAL